MSHWCWTGDSVQQVEQHRDAAQNNGQKDDSANKEQELKKDVKNIQAALAAISFLFGVSSGLEPGAEWNYQDVHENEDEHGVDNYLNEIVLNQECWRYGKGIVLMDDTGEDDTESAEAEGGSNDGK